MAAEDVAARITPRSRVLFLNTPHNPTGAVLRRDDLAALGEVARAHDLWIVSDEVYEEMVFPGVPFASPLDLPELAERTVVAASISKSHAAPGFRSGWLHRPGRVLPTRLLPLSETMLFGSQPFIADMTDAGGVDAFARGGRHGRALRAPRRPAGAGAGRGGGSAGPPARGRDVRAGRYPRDRAVGRRLCRWACWTSTRRGRDARRKLRRRAEGLAAPVADGGRRADRARPPTALPPMPRN